jgi:NADH dehydrogenase
VRPTFRYRDKGQMATVGRKVAVVQTRRVALHGMLAWLMWWVVHVIALVGFRNRAAVTLQWAWQWLTFQRGARLITGDHGPLPRVEGVGADGAPTLPPSAAPVLLAPAGPDQSSPTTSAP